MAELSQVFLPPAYLSQSVLDLILETDQSGASDNTATLEGFCEVEIRSRPDPVLVPNGSGNVVGALVPMNNVDLQRMKGIGTALGYEERRMKVVREGRANEALVFVSTSAAVPDDAISLPASNLGQANPQFDILLREIVEALNAGQSPARILPGALRRTIASHRAATQQRPATIGAPTSGDDAHISSRHRTHAGFFAADCVTIKHRHFSGDWSSTVHREVFLTGDAVSVLPWDPVAGRLLLIRQIRPGMVLRGDTNPWSVEAIAGLLDREEALEDAIRREAREEAGLDLGKISPLATYYTSPGSTTEYIESFIAQCDLATYEPEVFGLKFENEDIETLIVTEDAAAAALDAGEIVNAPLVISLLAFMRKRSDILANWGIGA